MKNKNHRRELRFPRTIVEPVRHVVEARDLGVTSRNREEAMDLYAEASTRPR